MSGAFKGVEHEIVYDKLNRGEETGAISRILSGITILILVYLSVHLFKDQQYIPLGILLISCFNRFNMLVSIGLLVYFFIAEYWSGATLLLLYVVIGWASAWFGARNIKRNLYTNRAKVSPFEGLFPILLCAFIFQVILFILASVATGIVSLILWAIFGLIVLWAGGFLYHRSSSPWRRLHFSLMARYSAIVGSMLAADITEVLGVLIKNVYPDWGDDEINSLIESAEEKMVDFSDRVELEELFKKSKPPLDQNKLQELMDRIGTALRNPEKKMLRIGYVIGEIVGRDYGEQERLKYIHAVITGKAS